MTEAQVLRASGLYDGIAPRGLSARVNGRPRPVCARPIPFASRSLADATWTTPGTPVQQQQPYPSTPSIRLPASLNCVLSAPPVNRSRLYLHFRSNVPTSNSVPVKAPHFWAEGCITDYWTVHQPAKDWVVLTQLLRISAAVITLL